MQMGLIVNIIKYLIIISFSPKERFFSYVELGLHLANCIYRGLPSMISMFLEELPRDNFLPETAMNNRFGNAGT